MSNTRLGSDSRQMSLFVQFSGVLSRFFDKQFKVWSSRPKSIYLCCYKLQHLSGLLAPPHPQSFPADMFKMDFHEWVAEETPQSKPQFPGVHWVHCTATFLRPIHYTRKRLLLMDLLLFFVISDSKWGVLGFLSIGLKMEFEKLTSCPEKKNSFCTIFNHL